MYIKNIYAFEGQKLIARTTFVHGLVINLNICFYLFFYAAF